MSVAPFLPVPCPVCHQTDQMQETNAYAAFSPPHQGAPAAAPSCQHGVGIAAADTRRQLDDWLDDCRLFGSRMCLVCQRHYPANTQVCSSDGTVLRDATVKNRPAPLIDGRLQLTSFIGSGALTDVYAGTDLQTNTGVAVKILRRALSHDAKFSSAFLEQAMSARTLNHKNIATIYDCGVLANRRPFIVSEYLSDYRSLLSILNQESPSDYIRLLKIMIASCRAIEYAHSMAVLHLYPSAANIVMCANQNGQDELVKVCDFGFAERLFRHLPVDQHASRTMGLFGSPLVISPEYSSGQPATELSDVYGLACVLYLILTGQPAFMRESALSTVMAHLQDSPPPLAQPLAVPAGLADIVFSGLAKNPGERPSLAEFRLGLEHCLAKSLS